MSDDLLGGLFECAFDEYQAALGLFPQNVLAVAQVALRAVQFIGDGQGREHRDFLRVYRRSSIRYGAHFLVHEARQFQDVVLVQLSADRICLAKNLCFYGHAYETRFYGVTGAKIAQSLALVV